MLCDKKFFQIHNLHQPNMGGHKPFHPPILILDLQVPKKEGYVTSISCLALGFPFISFHFNKTSHNHVSFRFLSIPVVSHTNKQKKSPNTSNYEKKRFHIHNLHQPNMGRHKPFHPPILILDLQVPKKKGICYIYFMSSPWISISFPFISFHFTQNSPKIHSTSFAFISFHFLSFRPKFTQNSFNQFCFHLLSFPFISPKIHTKFIQPVLLSFPFISFHFLSFQPKFTQNSFDQFCFQFATAKNGGTQALAPPHYDVCFTRLKNRRYVRYVFCFHFLSFPFISFHFTQNSPKIHPKFIQPVLLSFPFISFHFNQNSPTIHPKFIQSVFLSFPFISFHFLSFPFISPKIHPKFFQLILLSYPFTSFHFLSFHPKFTHNSPKIHSISFPFISFHFLSFHPKFIQNSTKMHPNVHTIFIQPSSNHLSYQFLEKNTVDRLDTLDTLDTMNRIDRIDTVDAQHTHLTHFTRSTH